MGSSTRSNPAPVAQKNEVSSKRNDLILTIFNRFRNLSSDEQLKRAVEKLSLLWDGLLTSVCNGNPASYDSNFDLVFEQTLRVVLGVKLSAVAQTHLSERVERVKVAVQNASNCHGRIVDRSVSLKKIISTPWSDPLLDKILHEEPNIKDVLPYFQSEDARVIIIRLEFLLQGKLEERACQLSKFCLQAYSHPEGNLPKLSENDRDYISDIYYCTLYRGGKDLIGEVKLLTLDEGLRLLKRYRKNGGIAREFNVHYKDSRVWKRSSKVVEEIADTLLTKATLNDSLINSDTTLSELLAEWVAIYKPAGERRLPEDALKIMKKLIIAASSSRCIYAFCAYMIEHSDVRNIFVEVLEWLIRAINENINEVEQYKVSREYPRLESALRRLADAFVMVSKLFSNCVHISRECLLLSFSLLPSSERLAVLETFVTDSQQSVVEEPLEHVIASPNQAVPSIPKNTSQPSVAPQPSDVNIVPAYYAELERLNIAESIKQDLNTILRYHRCPSLSRELKWSDLKDSCVEYLKSFEEHGFTNDVELKFLDLDYNQFKNQPIDYENYIGIEKGYEQYVQEEDLQPIVECEQPSKNAISNDDQQLSSDDSSSDYEETLKRAKKNQKRKRCTSRFSASGGSSEPEMAKFVDGSNERKMAKRRKKHDSYVGSSAYQKKTDKKGAKRVAAMSVMVSEDLPPRADENDCKAERKQSGVGGKLKSSFPGKLFNVREPYCKDVDILPANRNLVNKLDESSVHRPRLTMRIKKAEFEESEGSGHAREMREFRFKECTVLLRRLDNVDHLLSTAGSHKSSENSSPVTSSSSHAEKENCAKVADKSAQVVKPIILRKVPSNSNAVLYEIVNL